MIQWLKDYHPSEKYFIPSKEWIDPKYSMEYVKAYVEGANHAAAQWHEFVEKTIEHFTNVDKP